MKFYKNKKREYRIRKNRVYKSYKQEFHKLPAQMIFFTDIFQQIFGILKYIFNSPNIHQIPLFTELTGMNLSYTRFEFLLIKAVGFEGFVSNYQ